VFKVDASVKTSSPLPDWRVNHSLVKFVPCRHNALLQLTNVFDSTLVDIILRHGPHCIVQWTQVCTVQWLLVFGVGGIHSLVIWLSVTRQFHEPDALAHCLAENYVTLTQYLQGKGRTLTAILSKLCVVLLERQKVKSLSRNNVY